MAYRIIFKLRSFIPYTDKCWYLVIWYLKENLIRSVTWVIRANAQNCVGDSRLKNCFLFLYLYEKTKFVLDSYMNTPLGKRHKAHFFEITLFFIINFDQVRHPKSCWQLLIKFIIFLCEKFSFVLIKKSLHCFHSRLLELDLFWFLYDPWF